MAAEKFYQLRDQELLDGSALLNAQEKEEIQTTVEAIKVTLQETSTAVEVETQGTMGNINAQFKKMAQKGQISQEMSTLLVQSQNIQELTLALNEVDDTNTPEENKQAQKIEEFVKQKFNAKKRERSNKGFMAYQARMIYKEILENDGDGYEGKSSREKVVDLLKNPQTKQATLQKVKNKVNTLKETYEGNSHMQELLDAYTNRLAVEAGIEIKVEEAEMPATTRLTLSEGYQRAIEFYTTRRKPLTTEEKDLLLAAQLHKLRLGS